MVNSTPKLSPIDLLRLIAAKIEEELPKIDISEDLKRHAELGVPIEPTRYKEMVAIGRLRRFYTAERGRLLVEIAANGATFCENGCENCQLHTSDTFAKLVEIRVISDLLDKMYWIYVG